MSLRVVCVSGWSNHAHLVLDDEPRTVCGKFTPEGPASPSNKEHPCGPCFKAAAAIRDRREESHT